MLSVYAFKENEVSSHIMSPTHSHLEPGADIAPFAGLLNECYHPFFHIVLDAGVIQLSASMATSKSSSKLLVMEFEKQPENILGGSML